MRNPASLANLKRFAFKPGQSGNTRGRPKAYHTVLRLARANTPDAIRALIKCMNDENAPWASRVAAANGLLDRAWGKPKEYGTFSNKAGFVLPYVIEFSIMCDQALPGTSSKSAPNIAVTNGVSISMATHAWFGVESLQLWQWGVMLRALFLLRSSGHRARCVGRGVFPR